MAAVANSGALNQALMNDSPARIIKQLLASRATPTEPRMDGQQYVPGTLDIALKYYASSIEPLLDAGAKASQRTIDFARTQNSLFYDDGRIQRKLDQALIELREVPAAPLDPIPQLEEEEGVQEPAAARSGIFGRVLTALEAIWGCILSIFAGIGRLFSGVR